MASDPVLSRQDLIAWCEKVAEEQAARVDYSSPAAWNNLRMEHAFTLRAIAQALQEDEAKHSDAVASMPPSQVRSLEFKKASMEDFHDELVRQVRQDPADDKMLAVVARLYVQSWLTYQRARRRTR